MTKRRLYNPKKVEKKWQDKWEKTKIHFPDVKKAKKPFLERSSQNHRFYNLWMFPYPSAEGLHAGHAFSSTGSDVYGRFMRMRGKDVFQPIGYDSFGIHSENFALSIGEHPQKMLVRTTKNYERQLRNLGHGYDWDHTVTTSDVDYYKWTQWLFVQMFKAGLAYRAKAEVNWCPSCKTVLADEQVIAGKCERCLAAVEIKDLEQWFFRITDYAERLLGNLEKIDWPEKIKAVQRNWIGKSEGMLIDFEILNSKSRIQVFTTRPDTLNAVSFLATSKLYEEGSKEKRGKFTGKDALHPLTGRRLPIWDTNYVAPGYGTGIIMGVPAHDERDMDFAKKYGIDIIKRKLDKRLWQIIEEKGWGKPQTNYHLRDWLISRQRYWGTPIPMLFCKKCGWQPVNEKDLPVKLPFIEDYKPRGTGRGPLADHSEFYKIACPECGGTARRETDVSDTFLDSSWYFLRYPSVGSDSRSSALLPWDPEITRRWLPVDLYFGGAEHAVLHLMYARFVWMVLYDLGHLPHSRGWEEPFPHFFAHGLMTKDGAKMSKSRGNVVNPDKYIEKFGADAFRLYLMFIGPMDGSPDFRDTGMEGMRRFIERVWKLFEQYPDVVLTEKNDSEELLIKMHQTIKKATEEVQNFRYNTAIAAIMEFVNLLYDKALDSPGERSDLRTAWPDRSHSAVPRRSMARKSRSARLQSDHSCSSALHHPVTTKVRCAEWDETLRVLVKLLAPFAPHLTEEVWVNVLGEKFSIHTSPWPKYDADLAKETQIVLIVQIDGKMRGQLVLENGQSKDKTEVVKLAKKDPKIQKWLKNKKIKKTVFVPEKIVNFVTK